MSEKQWDIKEVKRMKKKKLFQYNFVMVFISLLISYFIANDSAIILCGVFCVIFWLLAANSLYILITENTIGTSTSRRLKEYDKDRLGKKRWRRNTLVQAIFINLSAIGMTWFLFVIDFDSITLNFPWSFFHLLVVGSVII
ncbi:hypothetical protein [Gracilibacillus kekensis]|uniref:Uncharacterized protein n=1 Tax=Gracilibacillus kekensis TaxID=1027249 RepID=A0A1M7P1S1_9BACI|nr:hypothetical protein [Gracilibacillus kekensis]SHN10425.1 hypothetical protein SAMN05216179_1904 [Gracilibacillus kekensis]